MRQIFSALKRAFRNTILTVALVSLLSFSCLLIFSVQSSLAAAPTERQPTLEKGIDTTTSGENREEAYEEAVKAINDPKGVEKEYEENLDAFKETQPNKGLVEEAKDLVEKVTK